MWASIRVLPTFGVMLIFGAFSQIIIDMNTVPVLSTEVNVNVQNSTLVKIFLFLVIVFVTGNVIKQGFK
jgi:hypothetical protein